MFSSLPSSASFVNQRFSLMHAALLILLHKHCIRSPSARLRFRSATSEKSKRHSAAGILNMFLWFSVGGLYPGIVFKLAFWLYLYHSFQIQSQSRSLLQALGRSSAVAIFVASRILYWSHLLTMLVISSSLGSIMTGCRTEWPYQDLTLTISIASCLHQCCYKEFMHEGLSLLLFSVRLYLWHRPHVWQVYSYKRCRNLLSVLFTVMCDFLYLVHSFSLRFSYLFCGFIFYPQS